MFNIKFVHDFPIKIIRQKYLEKTNTLGLYRCSKDFRNLKETIFIEDSLEHTSYYSVLFHELAHATGQFNRLNRKRFSNNKTTYITIRELCVEELIAERTAQLLMTKFNLFCDKQRNRSNEYIFKHLDMIAYQLNEGDIIQIELNALRSMEYILKFFLRTPIQYASGLFYK